MTKPHDPLGPHDSRDPQGTLGSLGRVGVWLPLHLPSFESLDRTRTLASLIERLGYGSLFSGENPYLGREIFAHHAALLAATTTLPIGTGTAHLEARAPHAMDGGAATLAEGFPGRFILGIGGHGRTAATGPAGPVAQLRNYLDDLDAAATRRGDRGHRFPRLLAALGPRVLDLAAERADGAHSFFTPVEHTAYARERLGPDRIQLSTQATMIGAEHAEARSALQEMFGGSPLRTAGAGQLTTLRRFGIADQELDRLTDPVIDALVARGDEAAVVARVQEQLDAGADSVLIHPIPFPGHDLETQLTRLASILLT